MKKLILATIIGIMALFVIMGSLIKTKPAAPLETRMVIDHTLGVYIAPPCFNEADITNYLEETTLERALTLEYTPESECTERALVDEPRSLLMGAFELLGLREAKWTSDGEWTQ